MTVKGYREVCPARDSNFRHMYQYLVAFFIDPQTGAVDTAAAQVSNRSNDNVD
ncbi:MAG: hypothetical protein ACRDRN_22405 [Sciscionella sp.]